MALLFLSKGSLSLGLTSIFFIFLFPLKWVWMPYFLHIFLMLSPSSCVQGMTIICSLLCLSLLESLPQGYLWGFHCHFHFVLPGYFHITLFLVLLMNLLSTLSKAHLGYLHLVRAFLRCCISYEFGLSTNCPSSVGEGADNTVFSG